MVRPRPRTWKNAELLYPAVWLLYLVFPLGAGLTADASVVTRTITSVLVIAFGVVYLSVYPYAHLFENNNELKLWGVTGILIVLAAGTYPVTDIFSVCFIPYFCALWVFIRPGRRGILIGVCVSTVLVMCALLVSAELRENAVPITLAVGGGIAIIIGMGVANANTERRQELERRLDRAHQREAYATAMHDVLSHSLTVIAVKAQLASRLVDADADNAEAENARKTRARREIDDIYELSHSTLNDMRSALDELSPPSLMETIDEAQAVCTSAGISLAVHMDEDLPSATASLYAAIVKEATTNILRHSEAQSASITATSTRLTITDDGRGFDQEKRLRVKESHTAENGAQQHELNNVKQHGLEGMKRRANNIGASFLIRSAPGKGTTVAVEPIPKEATTQEGEP
ncbi:sensor histidine kinase [Corynebacterium parakroppenstedtii]|uniref:sensor histidine kinase n=1 Tax=Corynebacterium parakroppenstedtii TaxID=2828363 RepID=UPI0030ECBE8D